MHVNSRYYIGQGERRTNAIKDLPVIDPMSLHAPQDYRASSELAAAVDVALSLGMPLLLTGEPGSGKSALAYSLAWELGLDQGPLRFVIKSDTQARDLFYRFDTVGRFHASQTEKGDSDPRLYISFEALGKAILHAKPASYSYDTLQLPDIAVQHPGTPRRSVVLIDEIDKAPRDVPNDILVEIERLQFAIPELGKVGGNKGWVSLDEDENVYRPIVIITSNSEKALPDPFLRRCVFHNVEFPPFKSNGNGKNKNAGNGGGNKVVTVEDIVISRLGKRYSATGDQFVQQALQLFRYIREDARGIERRPTLAELLDWLSFLLPPSEVSVGEVAPSFNDIAEQHLIGSVKNLLLKKPADQDRAAELLQTWRDSNK